MDVATLGIDLGKTWCSLVGLDREGSVVLRRKVRLERVIEITAKLPPCRIGIEAARGSHHLARILLGQGHDARLMPPAYVKPYVKSQKNDDRDAEAIAEAVTRPTMRFVPVKSVEQLDMQALHRIRERLMGRRIQLTNQIRALLFERGVSVPEGRAKLRPALAAVLDPADRSLSPRMRRAVEELRREWDEVDRRIAELDEEFAATARESEAVRRLAEIPGLGPLTATALSAAVGDASSFGSGRHLAAWLGLVPRQYSTGGKPKLLGIGKRGNVYVRTLLIHGARAALRPLAAGGSSLGAWARGLLERAAHPNIAIVALANKMARIAWAVLRGGGRFEWRAAAAAAP